MVGAVHRTARGRLRAIAPTRETLFSSLMVFHDIDSRSAALNMAIDEALLESASEPTIRFYRWNHPALSFGYFGRFAEVAKEKKRRDIVRRWTGGGIVFHGDDLTYAIVIPASDPAFAESSMSIYQKVHSAIRDTLTANGETVAALYERHSEKIPAVRDRRYKRDACFANPAKADVMVAGQKIAGAAQRRTQCGLLQQGSIQGVDLPDGFARNFATKLSKQTKEKTFEGRILERAREIAEQKYASTAWLGKR